MKKNVIDYGERVNKCLTTWMQVFRTFNKISNKEVVYINENDLTMNQFKVLEVLYHRGNLHVGAITKLTMSTPGNITVVIRNLKRDGLISSIQDPADKRASLLSISPEGKKVIGGMFGQHSKNLTSYFDVLSDEEVDTLFVLLRKLHKAQ